MSKSHGVVLSWAAAAASAVALSGCLVIPLNADGPAAYPVHAVRSADGTLVAAPVVPAPAAPSSLTLPVRLYPTNEAASAAGLVGGTVSSNLNGKGTFTLVVAGETMTGEATRTGGPSGRGGIANAYGSKGNYANCTYTMNSNAQGTGSCTFSNGATYQLHIGG